MRYGFVVDYRPDRDVAGVRSNIRRLHLTDVQFYDWAYRHADLLGGGESLCRRARAADHAGRTRPDRHRPGRRRPGARLRRGLRGRQRRVADAGRTWRCYADRLPYSLGDFLQLIDPADPAGWRTSPPTCTPRSTRSGSTASTWTSTAIRSTRRARTAPASRSRTRSRPSSPAPAPRCREPAGLQQRQQLPDLAYRRTAQDAVYIEVWAPHTTLGHLAAVVRDAHERPATASPWSSPHTSTCTTRRQRRARPIAPPRSPWPRCSPTARATCCAGEADRILVDPYYVRNHAIEPSTADLLRRWYDFHVEHGELLTDASLADMTGALAGNYNDDCDVTYPGVRGRRRPPRPARCGGACSAPVTGWSST